jgi:hypothetical protein
MLEAAKAEIRKTSLFANIKAYTFGQYCKLLYNEASLYEEKSLARRKAVSASSGRKAGEKGVG